jgi:redox-sensitive bicupin YhaK (pirin superfamily)
MSDLIKKCQLSDSKDCPESSLKLISQKIPTRKAQIGDNLTIRRALPHSERRMIGAWCFLDHFGPLDLKSNELDIAPHPHMGLQTFTWTIQGEIIHRDSLGSEQVIKGGQVNLMTSGHGISHSEDSLPDTVLHGVQLWIALPDSVRNMQPDFTHYPTLPIVNHEGLLITVLAGNLFDQQAPTKVYSPLLGLDIRAQKDTETFIPLNPKFEYGILPLVGDVEVEGEKISIDTLLYLGAGREKLPLKVAKDAHILIIGGEPFQEEILIWWNFVARTKAEIKDAIESWNNGSRFGEVKSYPSDKRLTAPEFPG